MLRDPLATYVIGHRNPDTDSICSAIAYADLLRRTREPHAIAARCGTVTARTEWVLRKAGLPLPELVMDVRLAASSIAKRDIASAAPHESFLDVYQRMIRHGYRGIPIVTGENELAGMLSLQDLLKLLLPIAESPEHMRIVRTSLSSMERSLQGKLAYDGNDQDQEQDLIVMVAASSIDTVRHRLAKFPPEQVLVVAGDRENIHRTAVEAGVRALIITGGFQVDDDIAAAAAARQVAILTTRHDTASTIQFIRGSRRIEEAISTDFLRFDADTLVQAIPREIRDSTQPLFPVVESGTHQLLGVFSRSDLVDPPAQKIILVDHNEFSQAVAGAEDAHILEVLDHHRLSGNLVSKEPVRFINLPVGSTCTIVGRLFWDQGLVPARSIATCMCAGIISDTLKLTSPTTTGEDRKLLDWLSKIAHIQVDEFAEEFFAAGSVLKGASPADALASDRKEYQESGYHISISQIEELGLSHLWPSLKSLQAGLHQIRANQIDIACVMITDIGRHFSILLIDAPERVLERIEYPKKEAGVFEMDGVVSRKKQLFPWLSRLLASIPKSY